MMQATIKRRTYKIWFNFSSVIDVKSQFSLITIWKIFIVSYFNMILFHIIASLMYRFYRITKFTQNS